jgi:hypothetical protein
VSCVNEEVTRTLPQATRVAATKSATREDCATLSRHLRDCSMLAMPTRRTKEETSSDVDEAAVCSAESGRTEKIKAVADSLLEYLKNDQLIRL